MERRPRGSRLSDGRVDGVEATSSFSALSHCLVALLRLAEGIRAAEHHDRAAPDARVERVHGTARVRAVPAAGS